MFLVRGAKAIYVFNVSIVCYEETILLHYLHLLQYRQTPVYIEVNVGNAVKLFLHNRQY